MHEEDQSIKDAIFISQDRGQSWTGIAMMATNYFLGQTRNKILATGIVPCNSSTPPGALLLPRPMIELSVAQPGMCVSLCVPAAHHETHATEMAIDR